MSDDPGYDDAISRATGSQLVPGPSGQTEEELVYSVVVEPQPAQLRYDDGDIDEALKICQAVEDAVTGDAQNSNDNAFDQDPNYQGTGADWGRQYSMTYDAGTIKARAENWSGKSYSP